MKRKFKHLLSLVLVVSILAGGGDVVYGNVTDNVQNASIEQSIGSSEGKQFSTIFDFLQGIWEQLNSLSTQMQDVKTAVNDNLDSGLVNISEWLGMGKESRVPDDEEYGDATLVEKMNYLQEKLKNTQSNPITGAGAEPLNFNNYITDISTFGANSYVLDPENSDMWYSLLANSLAMFGHKAIHSVVYERLTDDDVDYLLLNNQRLGQTFNSFYKTDVFVDGGIDTVLRSITPETYNKLEHKLQSGINRYVSLKTSGENAGEWLTTIFDKAELSSKTTIASVVRDTNLWNSVVSPNESLRLVVCLSVSADEFMSSNVDSPAYVSFIETVAQSTDATMTLINALADTEQLNTFFANEQVCNVIANSAPSMTAICYNTDGFAAMIASAIAMDKVAASEIAMDVIIEAITNVASSETVLDGIKGDLTSIETALPSIANTEPVITKVADVKVHITDVVTSLQTVTSQTDILISNIDAFTDSETAMTAIVSSYTAMVAILDSEEATNSLLSSGVAQRAMLAHKDIQSLNSSGSVSGRGVLVTYSLQSNFRNYLSYCARGGYKLTVDSDVIAQCSQWSGEGTISNVKANGGMIKFTNNFKLEFATGYHNSITNATGSGNVKYLLY